MKPVIRPYALPDRAAVRAICCDTAFLGEPIDRFFDDRELVADAVARYYTDYEPGNSFVVASDDRVAGYFLGCLDTRQYQQVMNRRILPLVLLKGLARGALWRRGTRRPIFRLIRDIVAGKTKFPAPDPQFPAHLHINLLDAFRGQGLGQELMACGLEHFRAEGAPGVHLQTIKENVRAVRFFTSCGFEPAGEFPAPFWPEEVRPLTVLTMTRKL